MELAFSVILMFLKYQSFSLDPVFCQLFKAHHSFSVVNWFALCQEQYRWLHSVTFYVCSCHITEYQIKAVHFAFLKSGS